MHVVVRSWRFAAPPWRCFEALVSERDGWLEPGEAERRPEVAEAAPSTHVVLAPWVHADIDQAEVVIESDGEGTRLRILLHGDHELGDERRKVVRHRLGELFGDRLRHWVDGW